MKTIKYTLLSFLAISFLACENDALEELRDRGNVEPVVLEEFDQGTADFSNYVSLGNSLQLVFLTARFTKYHSKILCQPF